MERYWFVSAGIAAVVAAGLIALIVQSSLENRGEVTARYSGEAIRTCIVHLPTFLGGCD